MITGLHHVNLVVPPDTLEEAGAFYAGTLGLAPRAVPELFQGRLLWFDIGSSGEQVHIAFGEPGDFAFSSQRHPCFRVAGVEALVALRQRIYDHFARGGVGAPQAADRPGGESIGPRLIENPNRFFARDYAGNLLEFSV
ncbi:hypothetical protein F4861DRAFT_522086 [Xylaria intraflava]|nr:hypothetical protein F4861DRAFT_522086 [Xylaria intraflava]